MGFQTFHFIQSVSFKYFQGVLDLKLDSLRDMSMLRENVKSVYDWSCVVLGLDADNPMQTFFLGIHTFF